MRNFNSRLNIYKRFILLLGAIFGFTSAIVAQYGAIETHYKFKGKLISDDCNKPIPNIEVTIKEDLRDGFNFKTKTDNNGYFEFNEFYQLSKYQIEFKDPDGKENTGSFKNKDTIIDFREYFQNTKNRDTKYAHWDYYIQNKKNEIFSMNRDGVSPCKDNIEYPDTSNKVLMVNADTVEIKVKTNQEINNNQVAPGSIDFDILVYPNPNNGIFNIKISNCNAAHFDIELFDGNLKLIYSERIVNDCSNLEKHINLEHIANGTYFLNITNESTKKTVKVVKI
ncbi:MAG: radical SAM-associated putative lipoprotein [Bacteroidetes bacterium]|nr:radical SAM-associated putative lipoprotein [Bacteroidota bacterium]